MKKSDKLLDILNKMKRIELDNSDREIDHQDADSLLCDALKLLGQSELVESFENIKKWYA